jgi:hypothetical protein
MGERYWFRPKSFGYGWTPITWEGWAVSLASAAVSTGAILAAVFAEVRRWPERGSLQVACLIVFVASLIATIVVCRNNTEEG